MVVERPDTLLVIKTVAARSNEALKPTIAARCRKIEPGQYSITPVSTRCEGWRHNIDRFLDPYYSAGFSVVERVRLPADRIGRGETIETDLNSVLSKELKELFESIVLDVTERTMNVALGLGHVSLHVDPFELIFKGIGKLVEMSVTMGMHKVIETIADSRTRKCWKCRRTAPIEALTCIHIDCAAPLVEVEILVLATQTVKEKTPAISLFAGRVVETFDDGLVVYERHETRSHSIPVAMSTKIRLGPSVEVDGRAWQEVFFVEGDQRWYALAASLRSHTL